MSEDINTPNNGEELDNIIRRWLRSSTENSRSFSQITQWNTLSPTIYKAENE